MEKELYIGVMSGTSMDAVDTVLVEINHGKPKLLMAHSYPFPPELKNELLDIATGNPTNLEQVGVLDRKLGYLFANAVNTLLSNSYYQSNQITAIGNHGQTVYHQPNGKHPFTMQLGDANIIAVQTGINTIADFRRKDIALGGQGAPLVPAFHQEIFPVRDSAIVVLNIGGIANISVLRPNHDVIGYDTGPGNMLMDAWCHDVFGLKYDKDAEIAEHGKVHQELLKRLLNDVYFQLPPPKSTGRELFNLSWLRRQIGELLISKQDIMRTLCEFTALTISAEVERYRAGNHPALLVCGGGVRNPLLMERLAELLPIWQVRATDEEGIDSDNMEAIAFAWLAYRRVHNLPSNLPDVTGASKATPLGVLYYA